MIYYTYCYCDPRKPGIWKTDYFTFFYEPFYIGEGKDGRMFVHLTETIKKNSLKQNKIKKIIKDGFEPIIIQLVYNLTIDNVLDIEASFIRQIGTKKIIDTVKRGPLTNCKLQEGRKYILSNEAKQKMSDAGKRRIWSDKSRAKIGDGHRGKIVSQEGRKNMSMAALQRPPITEETKQKMSIAKKGVPFSESHRKNLANAQIGRIWSEESKLKSSISHKNIKRSEEAKAITRDKMSRSGIKRASIPWKIYFEDGRESIIVNYLTIWCKENNVNYKSLRYCLSTDKFYHGFKLVRL